MWSVIWTKSAHLAISEQSWKDAQQENTLLHKLAASVSRTPITNLTDGQTIEQAFRVADKQLRVNRQGGKYILLKLADRSATIVAMLWNADERLYDSFDRGDIIHCEGRTQVHNGALQIIVTQLERMDPSEVVATDFERFSASESEALLSRLQTLIAGIEHPILRQLGEAFLADDELVGKLSMAAAAVNNHHAYPGGLLRHTVDLMELCKLVAPRYPFLHADLLIMGAFLHDLGKIEELTSGEVTTYTEAGQFVGHIVIGIQMLGEKMAKVASSTGKPFPHDFKLQLEHMIVSHHGQYEYGSPKLPVTLEAVALHHLDNLDAKIASFKAIIDTDVAAEPNWTNYQPSIGRKLWKRGPG
jgi:3'-5' exoribonuclease